MAFDPYGRDKAYLGGAGTEEYNLYRGYGRRALAEQQRAALEAQGRATGGELVGLPGYAAGSLGPGYLMRLRRESLRRGAGQIGAGFAQLGGQQAGREQDFLGQLLQRRLEARYAAEAEKRQRPTTLSTLAGLAGTVGGAYLGR